MAERPGRLFLHCPGPTNIPERVLRAMDRSAVLFPSPAFSRLVDACCERLRPIFGTESGIAIYAASGHGAWEAALANACSPGERILVCESGAFSFWWRQMAETLGLVVDEVAVDWRLGLDVAALEARLVEDRSHAYKAVLVVHTDTATSVTTDIAAVRRALDRAGHPALLMVDAIASLATTAFEMDAWGVDVAVCGSQKGLMLPPGLGFNAVSEKALAAAAASTMPRNYWDWRRRLPDGRRLVFSGTAPEHLMFGLDAALDMIHEEGLANVIGRHYRLSRAVHHAVEAWGREGGLALFARDPERRANSVTTIVMPEGYDGEAVRRTALARFSVALGAGLRHLERRTFRIGHLGDLNEPMILGALAGVEAALAVNRVPHAGGGVAAAIAHLAATAGGPADLAEWEAVGARYEEE